MNGIIASIDNGKFKIYETVSNTELFQLTESIKKLNSYEEFFIYPATICHYNIKSYSHFFSWTKGQGKKSYANIQVNNSYFKAQIAKHLLNFLTSFTTFDYLNMSGLSKLKSDEAKKEYEKYTKSVFDTTLNYRFLYKLCNYSKHFSLPIADISIKDNFQKENRKYEIKFELVNEKLLRYDSWGIVKNDIVNFNDKVDINYFLMNIFPTIGDIQKYVMKTLSEDIHQVFDPVYKAYMMVKDRCNFPLLAWPQIVNGKTNRSMDTILFPTSLLESLRKII